MTAADPIFPLLRQWERVGECREWTGLFDGKQPVLKNRAVTGVVTLQVRRWIWKHADRPLPEGHVVYMAVCCNSACVRLEHMAAGPRGEHMAHWGARGLLKNSITTRAAKRAAGRRRSENCTIEIAREVRRLLSTGMNRSDVATATGLTLWQVKDIGLNRTWAELPVASVFNLGATQRSKYHDTNAKRQECTA